METSESLPAAEELVEKIENTEAETVSTTIAFRKRKKPAAKGMRKAAESTKEADIGITGGGSGSDEDGDVEIKKSKGPSILQKKVALTQTQEKSTLKRVAEKDIFQSTHSGLNQPANQNIVMTIQKEIPNPNAKKNPFGPIRQPSNVRAISRFDYQPDLCKDYKETGFCGYGDACKFMHDRGDYKTGWQLEREYEQEQKRKAMMSGGEDAQEQSFEIKEEDDLPWACLICRKDYKNPVVTRCKHYFCEQCALAYYTKDTKCFACRQQTQGIFNDAIRLKEVIARRKALGLKPPAETNTEEDGQGDSAPTESEPTEDQQVEEAAANPAESEEAADLEDFGKKSSKSQKRQASQGWAL